MRALLAVGVAGVVSAAGAVILGEYEFVGITAFVIAGLFAVAVAEVAASVAGEADAYLAAAVALLTEAALVWALWIATGHRLDLAPPEAWVAVAAGAALGALWFRSAGRRGRRSRPAPSRTPAE